MTCVACGRAFDGQTHELPECRQMLLVRSLEVGYWRSRSGYSGIAGASRAQLRAPVGSAFELSVLGAASLRRSVPEINAARFCRLARRAIRYCHLVEAERNKDRELADAYRDGDILSEADLELFEVVLGWVEAAAGVTWSQVALERERRIASHLEAADRAVEVARVRAEYDVAASSLSKVLTRSLMMTEFERSCGTLRGMAKLPGTIIGSRTTRFSDGSWEQVFDREPRRHVGRCKKPSGCGKGYSAIVLAEVQTRSASYFDTDHGRLQQGRSSGYPIVMCSCGRFVTLHPVLGKYNPDKVCSAKCMSATGPSCECSCAGKNHGSSYG